MQAGQARVKGKRAGGGQVVRAHAVHLAAQVPHGQQLPGEELDVGVGGVFERHVRPVAPGRVFDALPQRAACGAFLGQAGGGDPAVLVLHASALKAQRVQHAVAVKPVVAPGRGKLAVGAVAHMHAVQVARDFTLNVGQIHRDFVLHRGKAALQNRHIVRSHCAAPCAV